MKNEKLFLFVEYIKTDNRNEQRKTAGHQEEIPGGRGGVVHGKAEGLDKVIEGIQLKENTIVLGKDIERIEDGGQVKKSLEKDRDDVLEVPDEKVEDGGDHGDAQREEEMQDQDQRHIEKVPGKRGFEDDHKNRQDRDHDQMIDISCQTARKREDHLGEIDFFYQIFVVDHGGGGDDHRLLDHQPGGQTGEEEDGVIVDIEFDDLGKNGGQDQKEEKRIEDGPEKSQDRTPVTELQFAEREVQKEVPETPQLS
jgi:hypothetical protein